MTSHCNTDYRLFRLLVDPSPLILTIHTCPRQYCPQRGDWQTNVLKQSYRLQAKTWWPNTTRKRQKNITNVVVLKPRNENFCSSVIPSEVEYNQIHYTTKSLTYISYNWPSISYTYPRRGTVSCFIFLFSDFSQIRCWLSSDRCQFCIPFRTSRRFDLFELSP